jgi:spore maturation protein CgeB
MWEILSNKTCCFVQKPFIIYPHKFVDGESCVYYETIDEFREKLDYYLQDKEECIRIGNNGYDHILKYHTSSKRVNYMLKVMEGKNWEKLYEN